jgi:hypothetical protein
VDYFEDLISELLTGDGAWVRHNFRIDMSPAEKAEASIPTMPRPEIDLLELDVAANVVTAWEVKSYLDSRGVSLVDLNRETDEPMGSRYKIFVSTRYRKAVLKALRRNLLDAGMIHEDTDIRLGLAAGKVSNGDEAGIAEYLDGRGWRFMSPTSIRQRTEALADRGYENSGPIILAKVLMR